MGVDVELAGNFAVDENRYDDFRFGPEGTGRARRQQRRQRQWFYLQTQPPADPLIEWDAGVRRHGAREGAQDEDVAIEKAWLNRVKIATHFKFKFLIRLIACSSRSSSGPTRF
jgi:hypothetical protein